MLCAVLVSVNVDLYAKSAIRLKSSDAGDVVAKQVTQNVRCMFVTSWCTDVIGAR
jgi:hypothetical protein